MNENETAQLLEIVKSLKSIGCAIVLIEHDMKFVMNVCERLYVLNHGEQIADGTIIPSPYKNACEYCEYGGLCLYDEETDNRTREVKSVTAEIIVQAGERNESISSGDPAPEEKQTGNGKEEEKE